MRKTLPFLLVALVVGPALACGSKPPPPAADTTQTEHVATVTPPPTHAPPTPAAPKCESLDEGCKAASDTKARVLKTGYVFTPPDGWTYAQASDATLAETSNAIVAVMTYDASDATKAAANRDAAFDTVVAKLGVVKPAAKVTWSQPADTSPVGDLKLSLWQVDGAKKGDKKGPLLVFEAPLPDKSSLFGAGFVPDDDTTDADKAILAAIKTLAPAPPKSSP